MKRALALLLAVSTVPAIAQAQTMEDRARAAAQVSRAKASDSDTLLNTTISPAMAGKPITTVDNSKSFTPTLACQKTQSLLEILVQPSASGDIGTVRISQDKDFDGTFDTVSNLPVPVSGICANGVISCAPGTWNQCTYFRWDVDASKSLKLAQVDMPDLSGCYCVNNSCGANLVWNNLASVLGDLGGGMVGALTTADPRIGVARAQVNGPLIDYVGAQSTACASDTNVPQTAYKTNPAAIQGDAASIAAGNSIFQMVAASPAGAGKAQRTVACTIERQVSMVDPQLDDIVARTAGGYATSRTGSNVADFLMGSPPDNSLSGGSCSLFDFRMTLHVSDPTRITTVTLVSWFADDWGQVRIDGDLLDSGPSPWTDAGLPQGKCEMGKTYYSNPNLDLKPWLTKGDHEIWLRVAVSKGGEGFADVHVEADDSCSSTEQLADLCGGYAADPKCHLDAEDVDGVETFRGGVATGLRPLPQTRLFGADRCTLQLTRDFFLRKRSYVCEFDNASLPPPDLSRGAYIIDHSTETLLADQQKQRDGTVTTSTRPFSLPDRGSVPACESICKTQAPRLNNAAAPSGVMGSQQNDPTGIDTFYHVCSSDNICPLGLGETMVSACGCLDDFPEAVVMMQTVRLGGADMTCTRAAP